MNRTYLPALGGHITAWPEWLKHDAENSADYLALLERKSPDLALLVKRWDTLPEAVRAGIMAMIRASNQPTD
ncbi:MAG: hypothetical protein O7D91_15935 [Planctomycetota bacterium]|nr:hypothetical protein [Planctomycetota bacterium]